MKNICANSVSEMPLQETTTSWRASARAHIYPDGKTSNGFTDSNQILVIVTIVVDNLKARGQALTYYLADFFFGVKTVIAPSDDDRHICCPDI